MSDYYDGIDREGEKEQKLMDTVYDWWDSHSEEEKHNLMTDWYPKAIKEDTDIDKFFGDLPSSTQVWIWRRENNIDEDMDLESYVNDSGDSEYEYNKENRRG